MKRPIIKDLSPTNNQPSNSYSSFCKHNYSKIEELKSNYSIPESLNLTFELHAVAIAYQELKAAPAPITITQVVSRFTVILNQVTTLESQLNALHTDELALLNLHIPIDEFIRSRTDLSRLKAALIKVIKSLDFDTPPAGGPKKNEAQWTCVKMLMGTYEEATGRSASYSTQEECETECLKFCLEALTILDITDIPYNSLRRKIKEIRRKVGPK